MFVAFVDCLDLLLLFVFVWCWMFCFRLVLIVVARWLVRFVCLVWFVCDWRCLLLCYCLGLFVVWFCLCLSVTVCFVVLFIWNYDLLLTVGLFVDYLLFVLVGLICYFVLMFTFVIDVELFVCGTFVLLCLIIVT